MKMRKYLLSVVAGFGILMVAPATHAATASGNFNVTVALTSVCTVGAIGALDFGTYIAFQGGAQTATPTTATFTCTRGLVGVTANFDTVAPKSTAAAPAANAVGAGVIRGLQYDITATPQAVVAGNAATAASIGTADQRPFQITGNMPAGQAGDPTDGVSPQQRTLTINF